MISTQASIGIFMYLQSMLAIHFSSITTLISLPGLELSIFILQIVVDLYQTNPLHKHPMNMPNNSDKTPENKPDF